MINLENINLWSILVQLIAAIGTIGSVLWAIHVYHKENDNRNLLDIKDNILKIPTICSDINILLSEPFFAAGYFRHIHWVLPTLPFRKDCSHNT